MSSIPSTDPELLFVEQQDTETDEAILEEMYLSTFQRHPYYVLDRTATLNIYGEPENEPIYTSVSHLFPFHIKLKPEEQELTRYGFDRTRDALIHFSSKIQRDRGVLPKIGDRFDFVWLNPLGQTVVDHFEILELSSHDFVRQVKVPYQLFGAASRTQKARKP